MGTDVLFKTLEGKILKDIQVVDNERITFTTDEDKKYLMYHNQDCCESVTVEDINGDLQDLLHSPITFAKVTSNHEENTSDYGESCTWTFYHLATIKGFVTIRWLGTSNGYYSESVDFEKMEEQI